MGGTTLGAGYAFASLQGGDNFALVLIGIGVIGGAGIGLAYVVPIAVGMRWFPDRKGMIAGAAVAGFGFGALAWIKMAGSWGELIDSYGLDGTFRTYGLVFAVLVIGSSALMNMPPEGWVPEGFVPPVTAGSGGEEFTPREMQRTPQFHLISLTFAVSAGAGLMAIGLMKLYPVESLTDSGLSETEASAIAGTAMALFFSIANGAGRLVWGTVSDRLGRKNSVIAMTASQGVLLFAFIPMAGNEYLLYLAATLIGFNFGGNFALFPALTADEFGDSTVGQNYPWVFLAYGAGGIVFPILGGCWVAGSATSTTSRWRSRSVAPHASSGHSRPLWSSRPTTRTSNPRWECSASSTTPTCSTTRCDDQAERPYSETPPPTTMSACDTSCPCS
jgi:OFA family oxalate/formate antiporter-like MFS transporter